MDGRAIDLCLVGGRVLDVRTGTLRRAAVAIAGDRIVSVGDAPESRAHEALDVTGRVIVPGYIEPHTHAVLATPLEFASALLRRGTTTIVLDALPLMATVRRDRVGTVLARLAERSGVIIRWQIRLHPASLALDEENRFTLDTLQTLWRLDSAVSVGEVTRWPDVHDGDPDLLAKIAAARGDGRTVEGHAAGASYERLRVLAGAGFTSCHEATTADGVRDRLRAGLSVMLRHSPTRPDLPILARALMPSNGPDGVPWPRLMLTVDGPTPALVETWGYLDRALGVAVREGIPPWRAMQMATLNPARYYGLRDRGEVAAGQRADLNVLADLAEPEPEVVVAGGRIVVREGRTQPTRAFGGSGMFEFDWTDVFDPAPWPRITAEVLRAAPPAPVTLALINDAITQPVMDMGGTSPAKTTGAGGAGVVGTGVGGAGVGGTSVVGVLRAALVDRRGRWITHARLAGFASRLGGLATTLNTAGDLLLVGEDPEDMARAAGRAVAMGGGIAVVEGADELFSLPLDLGGFYSSRPWAEVVQANLRFNALMRERGYPHTDPVISLLFLTFDSLPWVRLSARGVWDVRRRRPLAPASPL